MTHYFISREGEGSRQFFFTALLGERDGKKGRLPRRPYDAAGADMRNVEMLSECKLEENSTGKLVLLQTLDSFSFSFFWHMLQL